jgi:NAD+ kinase
LIITPISPHNLTVRPLVVPDDSVITLEIEDRYENRLLSLDSRSYPVETHQKISIRKADFRVRLVKFEGYHFFNTLRQKLNWGLDVRN